MYTRSETMFDFIVIDSKYTITDNSIAWLTDDDRNLQASFVYTQKAIHISADKRHVQIR